MVFRSVVSKIVTIGLLIISSLSVILTDAAGFKHHEKNKIQKYKNIDDLDKTKTIAADDNDDKDTKEFQCGLYLATSSIPNTGFGVYTTRSIAANDLVLRYPEAPSIIVVDFYEPSGNEVDDWNHADYAWEPTGKTFFEGDEVSESVMTFGSMCNYHPVLKSLLPYASGYNDTILKRYNSPGSGAISYYTGRTFLATRDIEAGEELFVDYGENWLNERFGTLGKVPRDKDYKTAAAALFRLNKVEYDHTPDELLSIVADKVSTLNERAASVLPDTSAKRELFTQMIDQILEKKTAKVLYLPEMKNILARSNLAPRDANWIRNNGICLEKIRPGQSTIPEAGRGGFAQMLINVGDIIAPAPLLNIPNKDSLLMYRSEINSDGDRVKIDDKPIGHQLLMNYCFGHMESKLILCPQTNAILINHCSTRNEEDHCNNGNGPNARVQWASGWDPDTKDWLQKSMDEIEELTANGKRGLSFDIIATTDIDPGEEIFIDYGENWENAWNSHVENWKKQKTNNCNKTYTPVKVLEDNNDFRTLNELKTNPYPDNIRLLCYGGDLIDFDGDLIDVDDDGDFIGGDSNDEEVKTEEIKVIDGSKGFDSDMDDLEDPDYKFPCDIHKKDEKLNRYEVQINFEEKSVIVKNYPEKSISIMMKAYSSDQHMEGAFRHFMEISDDIFPSHWKDN